jgi:hypothetical protein
MTGLAHPVEHLIPYAHRIWPHHGWAGMPSPAAKPMPPNSPTEQSLSASGICIRGAGKALIVSVQALQELAHSSDRREAKARRCDCYLAFTDCQPAAAVTVPGSSAASPRPPHRAADRPASRRDEVSPMASVDPATPERHADRREVATRN